MSCKIKVGLLYDYPYKHGVHQHLGSKSFAKNTKYFRIKGVLILNPEVKRASVERP